MKKKTIIIIIVAMIFTLSYSYHSFKCNEITDTYDWITLRNIYSTLDSIIYTYEKQYHGGSVSEDEIKNNPILREYFRQMSTFEWYLSLSPQLSDISLWIGKIEDIDYDGISDEELEYLINVRDNLKTYNDKINNEFREISVRRVFGIFSRSNVNQLEDIFEKSSN